MHTACPACNGLLQTSPLCPCGREMVNSGMVSDYFGPYSPYFSTTFESECCVHLFTCPACGNDSRYGFRLEKI